MNKVYTYNVIEELPKGTRLRNYLKGKLPSLETNAAVKKALKRNSISINGIYATSGMHVKKGDTIALTIEHYTPRPFPLDILYEDDHILIIDKPAGYVSSGNAASTVQLHLKYYSEEGENEHLPFPLLNHRLDKATSGILIASKTMEAKRILDVKMASNEINKTYQCIVEGHYNQAKQIIDLTIDDKIASTEITQFNHLSTKDNTSLLTIVLHTGRTHQIRKHLAMIGFPIVGDPLYNKDGLSFGRGLFLHAKQIDIIHPITKKELSITSPTPKKFLKYTQ